MPLNGNREELNTRGCIAIENNLLKEVDQIVNHRDSLLITFANEIKEAKKEDLEIILSDLFQWKEAWKNNAIDELDNKMEQVGILANKTAS